jgi:transcriptional regulator with XRE-family HTH domain
MWMTISKRLKERREELGEDVAALAKYCGVTPSAVYAWESGDTKGLKPANLVCAAEFLKTYEKWLATGEGPQVRALRSDELSEEESTLLFDLRDLTDDQKTGMKITISELAKLSRKKRGRS